MNKYTIIYNKNSRGRNIDKEFLTGILSSNNISFDLYDVTTKSETDSIIQESINNSVEYFCSVGGDGSLNHLVNTLIKNHHPSPIVACLPAGSGSDFIRTFGISQNINEAVKHLSTESSYLIDVGRIEYKESKNYFINVANIGFLADTVSTSEAVPDYLRNYRYSIGFWTRIVTAKPMYMNLIIDGEEYRGDIFNACICNGQFFGAGKNISPKSNLQDGKFNVQLFEVTKATAMKIFFKSNKGLHLREEGVITKLANEISILNPLPIEMDGDYVENCTAKIYNEKAKIHFKI